MRKERKGKTYIITFRIMPTLQEIIAKRKELMATGQYANEKEAAISARNQLTTPVAPTGTGATLPTPSPTQATNQAQLLENQANRKAMVQAGSIPAPNQPPATPTPETTPTAPTAPVTPNAPATPTAPTAPTVPVDKTAEIKAKNEAQLAINKQQAEQKQAERDKATQEANANLANSEGAILNTLKTGGIIPESVKTSPYYKSAQQTYNQLQRYSTYSTNELVTAMNQGAIIPWTNVYNEMMKDPAMKQRLSDAQIYRSATPVNTTQVFESASSNILADNPTTASYLSDGLITLDEYNNATNNTAVVAKAKEVEEKANKYNTLKAEYDSIEDEVKAQFPWSPFADAIIADRQKAKYKNLVLAKGEWETATGTLTELKSQASNLFETNLKLYEQRRSEENAYKMAQYQAQLGLQTKGAEMQMESDFAKKKAEEAMNDPQTAIQSVMEEYKKLGIPFTESIQTKVAKAEDFISKGGTLAGYLDKMQKDIQAKPEYQRYQALQQGQLSDREKLYASQSFDLKKMGMEQNFQMKLSQAKQTTNNKWTKLDDGMYTNESGEIITADELKSAKLMGNSYITKSVWEEGGDCGFYASRGTGMSATPGGNSKEARTHAFSDKTPQVGWMAFFGGAGYDKTYWHIAIVTWINADWSITVKDSNYAWDGKVKERTVPASSATGYYNNTPLAKSIGTDTQGSTGQYTDQNINDLAYLTELQEKNPTQASKDMKELGYNARDIANYKAGNVPLTDKQKQTSVSVIDDIKDLVTNYDWNDATGVHFGMPVISGTDRADTLQKIEQIVAKMTLPNIGSLKWPMSDKDLAFITKASSNLSAELSDSQFEKNLIQAYNVAARRAGIPEITKLNDIGKNTTPTQTPQTNTWGGQTYQGYTIKPF